MITNGNVLMLMFASMLAGPLACVGTADEFSPDDFDEQNDISGNAQSATTATYQAESYSFQSGCKLTTQHSGYTGTGFMDYGAKGSLVEWNAINASTAGQHTLVFRYANGSGSSRQCSVTVNDTTLVGNVEFNSTSSWTTWGTASIAARLGAGVNKIRVTANTSAGGPNLDKLDVTPLGNDSANKCAQGNEGSSTTLSCPNGQVIAAITYASYGTPTDSCPNFAKSACHASTSQSKVESSCLNKPSCTVGANNSVFGDPCARTRKNLAIAYTCSNGGNQKLKVFILAGQSNMVGTGTVNPTQAHLDKNGGMGTLKYLVNNASTRSTYAHLVNSSGGWASRNDVWLVDLDKSGPLTITKETFGPELQFGHAIGNYYQEQVLIIKTAWGGKSLYVDFRPPSSGGTVGPFYTSMVQRIRQVLADIRQFYPSYNGQGYDVVGFGWHQGWNDRIDSNAVAEYQTNCVHLINDLRRELNAPKMRFVLATTGMGGWNETHTRALALMDAQLAVPKDTRLQNGYVSSVETRGFWRDVSISPSDQGYHWNRNAETYFLIGNGIGKQMIDLIKTP